MSTDPNFASTDLPARAGFDPNFLGVPVALPTPVDQALPTVLLSYTHFSVLMRPDRRLAAVTGVGIDGATLRELPRAEGWQLDPRLPADQQTGEAVYARNDLDRGHLVRRRDPVWGSPTTAAQANVDTFHFTNAAPQAAVFNQSKTLWLGLENYLLDNAATYTRRLVVFTGCVLHPDDPTYRGVQLPLRFFKVAAFLDAGNLAATGYVLDQTPLVTDLPTVLAAAADMGNPPPLGRYRTFQVPITDIADLTGLDVTALAGADRLPVPTGARPDTTDTEHRWRPLHTASDIHWRRPSGTTAR